MISYHSKVKYTDKDQGTNEDTKTFTQNCFEIIFHLSFKVLILHVTYDKSNEAV